MSNIGVKEAAVFAIVVTYNPQVADLRRLTSALATQVNKILVVDNGSANIAELSTLSSGDERIQLLDLAQNMGIAFAQNVGIDFAKKAGAQYLIFFDQDSLVTQQFVQILQHAFFDLSEKHKIALVAPIFKDERAGFFYPLILLNKFGLRRKIVPNGNETSPIPISIAISSGTFTSIEVMDAVGRMRGDFFIDYVDIEWCLRAVRDGYSMFAIPSVCMIHSIGDRSIPFLKWRLVIHAEWRRYYRIRNGFFMLRLSHVPKLLAMREVLINSIHQLILILTQKNKKMQLKYFLRGVRDAFKALE